MVTYSPSGPFVPRVPTNFIPRNAQNFGPRTPRGTANVGRDVVLSPNGEFVPRFPTEFIPKNPQNFIGGQSALQGTTDLTGMDAAERNRILQNISNLPRQMAPEDPNAGNAGGMGGGMGGNPINALFAPMFEDLRRQRQLANKRYEANSQQVTNIYGQITGARSQDTAATETAFQRLIDAASTRSQAVNTGIDTSEAARLQQNQAALQSMGLGGLSTSQGDIASQTAAQAQQTNTLNAANWEGMLRTMGATAGQQIQSDIAGYNYAMLEDQGQLRGAREEFLQDLGQQRGQLKSQRAQATFEYQQAQQAAAAAAKAARQRAKADARDFAAKQQADALKESGPVLRIVDAYQRRGVIQTPESAAKVINTINEWFANVPVPPGQNKWSASSAKASLISIAAPNLTPGEQSAILAIFDEMDW
jgi:hypothetical protein